MSGYQVVIDKIRQTGQAATRVADGLRGVDCSATLPGGDAGMPGARCVPKLAAVKQAWQGREAGYVAQLDAHAGNMAKAAEFYSGNEQAAEQDMTAKAQPTSGPRPS
ncbi:hypothetical protein [Amycolatopsis nigrescens]|uniref:hypothetical protein n=1 Tax=Amycolatopsis nigrescens TaxID=381445 RepID=UPI00047641DD|nr:hypothetical protein [Amycolatopsis nigrescens]